MKICFAMIFATLLMASASMASQIRCERRESVTQTQHEASDYVTDYSVDGVILRDQARLRVVSREYSVKQENGRWVTDYNNPGNVHVDIDGRSVFNLVSKNGQYDVYASSYTSDRTGTVQSNLRFILNTSSAAPGQYQAVYSKTSETDDSPYHEAIHLNCIIQ